MREPDSQTNDAASEARRRRVVARNRLSTFLKILFGLIIFFIVTAVGVAIGFFTANINTKPNITEDIIPPPRHKFTILSATKLQTFTRWKIACP